MRRLLGQGVVAIVGPMTSSIAMAVLPQANEARRVLLSPTATTNALTGKDDHFLRVTAATRSNAKTSADYHFDGKGLRRMTAIYDTRNRAFTEDWLAVYREAFAARGGEVIAAIEFASSDDLHFAVLARRILATRPDGILLLANSVDAALLLQQIRMLAPEIVVSGSEWAATERLIELAGKAAEGFLTAQFYEREHRNPAYVAFRQAYLGRYGVEPGFAGTHAFDAANLLFDALERRPEPASLKDTLLSGKFAGVQSEIVFDAFGDVARPTFITTVSGGRFVAVR
jgi:branched-chain amino acid transport system substrate-binding protein